MTTSAGVSPYVSNFGIVTVADATFTLTAEAHAGKTIVVNRAAGCTITLPDATGSGVKFTVKNVATQTGDLVIQAPDADNSMIGKAHLVDADFAATAGDDTITLNGTTTGGIAGSEVKLQDVAADTWAVIVDGVSSGTEATPFSAAVS